MRFGVVGFVSVVSLALLACGSATTDDDSAGSGSAVSAAGDDLLPTDLTPESWNIETPADAPTPGTEPINVILSTDYKFSDIANLLSAPFGVDIGNSWHEVQLGTGFDFTNPNDWRNLAKGGACISPEFAMIDPGDAKAAQATSLRVAGCFPGVILEGESHVRAWESVKRRKSERTRYDTRTMSTWYLSVSQEHLCDVNINGSTRKWHCILPKGYTSIARYVNNGFQVGAPTGGYDKGRDDFVDDLKTAARAANGWIVDCKSIDRPASTPDDGLKVDGLNRVPWDGKATYCTVLNSKYQSQ